LKWGLSDQKQAGTKHDQMAHQETLELARAYYNIANPKLWVQLI